MPLKGEILKPGEISDFFEIPDPEFGKMISGRLQIQANIWRIVFWAPSHMISTGGAGRAYLKHDAVGEPIAAANLPKEGSIDMLIDTETTTVIRLTRTK